MKEISNISKSFTCECGTTNRFEFETDFDVHDVRMAVRCQACGRERTIDLMNFFRKHPGMAQAQTQQNNDYGQGMAQVAAPSFNDMVADYGQQPVPESYPDQRIANNDFQQAIPTSFMDAPAQANAMNMFEEQPVAAYAPVEPAQQQASQYAGLLDLAQEHLDSAPTLENDGIYEPFGKESENPGFAQNIQENQAQAPESLNPTEQARKTEDEEDDDTFSALFGNL